MEQMNLAFRGLTKKELSNLMKPLLIEELRRPVIENSKLEKKYITGFRVTNVTYIQLIPLYYQEIHMKNIRVQEVLKKAVYLYLNRLNVVDAIKEIKDNDIWEKCVKLGIDLGTSMCEISFEVLLKIFEIDLDPEKVQIINLISRQIFFQMEKKIISDENFENERREYFLQIEKLEKESEKIHSKEHEFIQQRLSLEGQLKQCRENLEQKQTENNELLNKIEEQGAEISHKERIVIEQENLLCDYKILLNAEKKYKNEIEEQLNAQSLLIENLKYAQIYEYNDTIKKLVLDTVDDLKTNYSLSEKQFDTIINSFDSENNILSIWTRLSQISEDFIKDIELSMRDNLVTESMISQCDSIENNILAKYIIIKAIKSLYFEYLSQREKNRNIGEEILVEKSNAEI